MNEVIVAGVGMTPFRKPGDHAPYTQMAAQAVRAALTDAGMAYELVQEAFAGYVYGDSTCGQAALYEVGMSGIPVVNVNNNCSTGSTALYLARRAIALGAADCVLALGFEQMAPGALGSHWMDRPSPLAKFDATTTALAGDSDLPMAIRYFAGAGAEHMQRYGTPLETFAKVRAKASRHAARNPLALFRKEVSAEEVLASPVIAEGVMTRLMACPPTCGAAAALLVSPAFAKRHGIDSRVRVLAQSMTTDRPSSFESGSMMSLVGLDMSREAAQAVYREAGIGPEDVDVCELHDCFAQNELISYEALGFCEPGGAQRFVDAGDNTYGGAVVINPSGGLLSKGHPLGATGLAQCYELVQQLRGHADLRQVQGARLALQHNIGIGGAAVVTLYGLHD
ncbi:lipid-transfer protein [Comamonas composti]|uniref:lipid-transfer protein n=1 Tax=Comamonas composti TaxID=408558 RepID=UPI000412B2C2|nr:lipid-transfer protein [Comamonas composti]